MSASRILRAPGLHAALAGATLLALAATPFNAAAQAAAGPRDTDSYAPGRILVMPRAGMSKASLDKLLTDNGSIRARRVGQSELRIVDVPPGLEKATVDRLAGHPHFKFAEVDQAVRVAFAPNDPYLGSEWHIAKINAPLGWDSAQGAGVTIAIIDTGVDASHPDLFNRLVAGYNFYDNNTNTSPVNGHGTWVAGTAGATISNGIGVAGVAGAAKLMPLRVVDSAGVGYWSSIASAITYAADQGARVANASFENLLSSSSVMSAAAYMKSRNGLVVIAAGNSGTNANLTPNASVIAVSATDSNDQLATFSSYGSYVALSAPGTAIYTTGLSGSYVQGQGTSFSSPTVAGTIALMMSANPKLLNTDVEKLLYSTATDLGAAGRDIYYGYGRVNAGAAVAAAMTATSTTSDTQVPTVSISAPLGGSTVSGLVPVNLSAADNVGVTKVELRVNGGLVSTDAVLPFAFSWDSKTVANGMVNLSATAYDAAGNAATSSAVAINVANAVIADTTPPVVSITSPTTSTVKSRGSLSITASAADNSGSSNITQRLYIDSRLVSTVTGGTLSYSWSLNKVASGAHLIKVTATDAAGNASFATLTVYK